MTILDQAKKIWGTNAPRGFKASAWVAAFGAFGLWYYAENYARVHQIVQETFDKNKQIKK